MTGTSTAQLRSAFVSEATAGTIPTSPAWRVMHTPIIWQDDGTRAHQQTLIGNGALIGDALLNRTARGSLTDTPMTYLHCDQHLETLLQGAWTTDVLTAGMGEYTMSVENAFAAGVGGTLNYKRYTGVEAIAGNIKGRADGLITQSFDFVARNSNDLATSALSGATYTNTVNSDPFSCQTDFGTFTAAGYTLDDLFEFQIDFRFGAQGYGSREEQPKMGGDGLVGISRGGFQPTITAKFYVGTNVAAFQNAARAAAQTAFKITFNFGSVTAKKYKYEFHKCYIDQGSLDWSGATGFANVMFTPVYSTSDATVLTVTRAIA